MGKKTKVGKDRKDKFYKLAKETGFRSRAAFKLIQLNRKFGFLQQSRVCVDLCAAPGGWMQVAKQNMPISSIVIGIDLYPIKPIHGCISFVEDITTDKCKALLTKELQTWKADVILHDGAPNVGKNWLYDAYQQICLTLSAVKLSTSFLRSGGWFVTKVFRSKDYNALMWVLTQLFRKVHATKPSASRKESAEIFIVCQNYIAPDKIDPRFLDAKYVFEELELDSKKTVSLLHPDKKRIKAEGYSETDFSKRQQLPVSEFLANKSALGALQGVSEIIFDSDEIRNHPLTTDEIIECCKDIKVLGRKDIRSLLNWWKHLKADLYQSTELAEGTTATIEDEKKELTKEEQDELEFEELQQHIADLEMEETKDLKRKKKKVTKARQKLNEKLSLKMVLKGDSGPQEEDAEVFSLHQIQTKTQLDQLQDQSPDFVLDMNENINNEFKPKYTTYSKDEFHLDKDGLYKKHNAPPSDAEDTADDTSENLSVDGGLGLSNDDDDDDNDDYDDVKGDFRKKKPRKPKKSKKSDKMSVKQDHPLITDLDTRDKDSKRKQRVQLWFEKDKLRNVDESDNADEDFDLDKLTTQYKEKGIKILGENHFETLKSVKSVGTPLLLGKKAKKRAKYTQNKSSNSNSSSSSSDDDDSPDNANYVIGNNMSEQQNDNLGKNEFEIVPQQTIVKPIKGKLSETELALGALLIQSNKRKRDLIDSAWNRYAFNDDNLPNWFVQDEQLHMTKEAPVPKELIEEYRNKVEELNVRPIKKVMEAKARKKKRAMKRLEKAKKKAETIIENADASSQEKVRLLKKLYKKAHTEKKDEVKYVVTKKHLASKRARRPAGVKGRFKVVDPRMKKDKRAALAKQRTKNRRKR